MDKNTEERLSKLMQWIDMRYLAHATEQVKQGMPQPDRGEFYVQHLGVPPQTVNRWRRKQNPPDDSSLLVMAMVTRDPTPLLVMDRQKLVGGSKLGGLLFVNLDRLSEEDLNKILNQLQRRHPDTVEVQQRIEGFA